MDNQDRKPLLDGAAAQSKTKSVKHANNMQLYSIRTDIHELINLVRNIAIQLLAKTGGGR